MINFSLKQQFQDYIREQLEELSITPLAIPVYRLKTDNSLTYRSPIASMIMTINSEELKKLSNNSLCWRIDINSRNDIDGHLLESDLLTWLETMATQEMDLKINLENRNPFPFYYLIHRCNCLLNLAERELLFSSSFLTLSVLTPDDYHLIQTISDLVDRPTHKNVVNLLKQWTIFEKNCRLFGLTIPESSSLIILRLRLIKIIKKLLSSGLNFTSFSIE